MKTIIPGAILAILLSPAVATCQTKSDLSGIWKGTSLCQVKNSPCHDENVVYYISKLDSLNRCRIVMNKIVDKKEQQMGAMNFEYDAAAQTLTSKDGIHETEWKFTIKGSQIDGTLHYKSNLYRIINIKKGENN